MGATGEGNSPDEGNSPEDNLVERNPPEGNPTGDPTLIAGNDPLLQMPMMMPPGMLMVPLMVPMTMPPLMPPLMYDSNLFAVQQQFPPPNPVAAASLPPQAPAHKAAPTSSHPRPRKKHKTHKKKSTGNPLVTFPGYKKMDGKNSFPESIHAIGLHIDNYCHKNPNKTFLRKTCCACDRDFKCSLSRKRQDIETPNAEQTNELAQEIFSFHCTSIQGKLRAMYLWYKPPATNTDGHYEIPLVTWPCISLCERAFFRLFGLVVPEKQKPLRHFNDAVMEGQKENSELDNFFSGFVKANTEPTRESSSDSPVLNLDAGITRKGLYNLYLKEIGKSSAVEESLFNCYWDIFYPGIRHDQNIRQFTQASTTESSNEFLRYSIGAENPVDGPAQTGQGPPPQITGKMPPAMPMPTIQPAPMLPPPPQALASPRAPSPLPPLPPVPERKGEKEGESIIGPPRLPVMLSPQIVLDVLQNPVVRGVQDPEEQAAVIATLLTQQIQAALQQQVQMHAAESLLPGTTAQTGNSAEAPIVLGDEPVTPDEVRSVMMNASATLRYAMDSVHGFEAPPAHSRGFESLKRGITRVTNAMETKTVAMEEDQRESARKHALDKTSVDVCNFRDPTSGRQGPTPLPMFFPGIPLSEAATGLAESLLMENKRCIENPDHEIKDPLLVDAIRRKKKESAIDNMSHNAINELKEGYSKVQFENKWASGFLHDTAPELVPKSYKARAVQKLTLIEGFLSSCSTQCKTHFDEHSTILVVLAGKKRVMIAPPDNSFTKYDFTENDNDGMKHQKKCDPFKDEEKDGFRWREVVEVSIAL